MSIALEFYHYLPVIKLLFLISFCTLFAWTDYKKRKLYALGIILYFLLSVALSTAFMPLITIAEVSIFAFVVLGISYAAKCKVGDSLIWMACTFLSPFAGILSAGLFIISIRYWYNPEKIPAATRYVIFMIPLAVAFSLLPI